MAYTTVQQVKNAISVDYWKSIKKKLTQDGWAYDELNAVFTDESDFIEQFIDQQALLIEGYLSDVAAPPFAPNGLLENINRWLAIYDCEQYLLAGTVDRVVSVTINEDKKRALNLLELMAKGVIPVNSADEDSATAILNGPGLIEPECDGEPLAIDAMEEDVFFGNSELTGTALEYQA